MLSRTLEILRMQDDLIEVALGKERYVILRAGKEGKSPLTRDVWGRAHDLNLRWNTPQSAIDELRVRVSILRMREWGFWDLVPAAEFDETYEPTLSWVASSFLGNSLLACHYYSMSEWQCNIGFVFGPLAR